MKFSVIVCTYNREKYIIQSVDSILASLRKSKEHFEVLIIDNNSTDSTSHLLKKYEEVSEVKYIKEVKQGLSHARNRGIVEAQGEILVYLDDDIEIDENYFLIVSEAFSDPNIHIAGGKVLPFNENIPSWLPEKFYYLVSIFDMGDMPKELRYIMGGNCAIRKSLVDKVGLYDIELGRKGNNLMAGEENEYMDRISALGYKIYYIPGITIYHKINEKLNTEYVYSYAFQNGKSNGMQYRKTSPIRYFLKYVKQYLTLVTSNINSVSSEEERIKVFYAKGYTGKVLN